MSLRRIGANANSWGPANAPQPTPNSFGRFVSSKLERPLKDLRETGWKGPEARKNFEMVVGHYLAQWVAIMEGEQYTCDAFAVLLRNMDRIALVDVDESE